ncbi:MAG: DUF2232 domain-containing protein [Holosporaceae bacterium]|jgi:riboflavin transporter FmnP|nr:DUF2232 domain-containing protein [Holosporaceae bacterium]
MLQISLDEDFRRAAFLGVSGAFFIFCGMFSSFHSISFLSGVPISVAYLAYGDRSGFISLFIATILLFLVSSPESSCDLFLNIMAPAALLGHFSIKNIVKNRKTWWYPETFLLRNLVLLFAASTLFLSLTIYSEDVLLKAAQNVKDSLLQSSGANAVLLQQYFISSMRYSVGIGALIKIFIALSNFSLAHCITKKIKKNIRPGFDFKKLTFHYFFTIFPLVSLTLANIFTSLSFVGSGLFVVGLFAPMAGGLSVVHRFFEKNRSRLITFYLALLLITLPLIVGVIILGIVDSFFPLHGKTEGL